MIKSGKTSRKSFEARLNKMVESLRSNIYDGKLAPGEYLPSEKMLTEQYSLSNKSVRKGLDILVEEQLIIKIDRVGSRVVDHIPHSETQITLGITPSIERDICLTALLEDFQSLYPDKRVRTIMLKSALEYADHLKEVFDQTQIDLFTLNNLDFQSMMDLDQLCLLESLQRDENLYDFAEYAFDCEEMIYARPIIFAPTVLAYNRAHFLEADVPEPNGSWTWEDCLHYARKLTKAEERHGLYFYLLSDNRWPAFMVQSGMKFETNEDGSFELAGTRLMECIRLCKRIISDPVIYPSYLSENSGDVSELFAQGKLSMIMVNYMSVNAFKETELDFDISPLPYMNEPRSLLNVIGTAIYKNSKNKEDAQLLMDYLVSERAQLIIRKLTLSLPSRRKQAELRLEASPGINRPSRFDLFRETMYSYRLHRELNLSTAAFAGVRQLLKKYWWGLIDDEALCVQANELFIRLNKEQAKEVSTNM